MASFTVLFYGICTNFRHVPGVPHVDRMVLVNGDEGNIAYLETQLDFPVKINPHLAWLWVEGAPEPIRLQGVLITVEDVVPGLHFPTELLCVPNLTRLNDKGGTKLGPPAPVYVLDENAAASSCYFDFTGGTFIGCASAEDNASAMTRVAVETTGSSPRLRMKSFTTGEVTTVDVPDGGKVWLLNVPEDASFDHEEDFYLHYLTAKKVPKHPVVPVTITCPTVCGAPPKLPARLETHAELVAGAGCSNSNFP